MDARHWQAQGAERYRAGDLAGAEAALLQAAELQPDEPDYLRNLAELARERGDLPAARQWMDKADRATRAAPSPERLVMLAAGLKDLGNSEAALDAAAESLGLRDTLVARQQFADALRSVSVDSAERRRDLVARAMAEAWVPTDLLHSVTSTLLLRRWPPTEAGLAADQLLAAVLTTSQITGLDLERRLTALRKDLLLGPPRPELSDLQARLAIQCFINEYAWAVSGEEQAVADTLMTADATPETLLRLAAYVPLSARADMPDLLSREWPGALQDVVKLQVEEPRRQREVAASIPRLTPIEGEVSTMVQAMYEENPYPRWIKAPAQEPQNLARIIRSALPRAAIEPISGADAPDILIAGCGTGKHAIHAAGRYAGAKVLAVDLSLASLSYARTKARDLGVQNVEFGQADVLELRGRTFDVIDAAGSLQCMENPLEAAKTLVGMLRPGGLFRLGLYSAVARRELLPAMEFGRRFPHTPDGIRQYRAAIANAPDGDPVRAVLAWGDFYTTSACRDLVLHVKEHVHTFPQLRELIDAIGCRLLGFVVPPAVLAAYRRDNPHDPAGIDLDAWAAFEERNPETFRLMYQFWVQKPAEARS